VYNIILDHGTETIINELSAAGFKAYAVGGAVRDGFLGTAPKDFDIATNAPAEKIADILNEFTVIPTGIKFGTVTAVAEGKNYEITTFRTDGQYTDNRRPENVKFVGSLREDLERRDFTMNAMAYNKSEGMIDFFGGVSDIDNKTIRAVGDPDKRFKEDALRILRAVRFASVLGCKIDGDTKKALFINKDLLKNISAERIFSELKKLLCGNAVTEVLTEYAEIIFTVIPELKPCYKFYQNNPWHCYDVYEHIAVSVGKSEKDEVIRIALLLHDAGKPEKYFERDGIGHFYGHAEISAEIAEKVLKRLKADNKLKSDVINLVSNHDTPISDNRIKLKKLLNRFGKVLTLKLIQVEIADSMAQNPEKTADKIRELNNANSTVRDILKSGECYSLDKLEADGNDLIKVGISGAAIGETLDIILNKVICGDLKNERENLLNYIKKNCCK